MKYSNLSKPLIEDVTIAVNFLRNNYLDPIWKLLYEQTPAIPMPPMPPRGVDLNPKYPIMPAIPGASPLPPDTQSNIVPPAPGPIPQDIPPATPGLAQPGLAQDVPPTAPGLAQDIPPATPGLAQDIPPIPETPDDLSDVSSDISSDVSTEGDTSTEEDPNLEIKKYIGLLYNLREIYSKLIKLESFLDSNTYPEVKKIKDIVTESIDLLFIIITSINQYKDKLDKLVILYYLMIKNISDFVLEFYKKSKEDKNEKIKIKKKEVD